jgi:hypothetical protein
MLIMNLVELLVQGQARALSGTLQGIGSREGGGTKHGKARRAKHEFIHIDTNEAFTTDGEDGLTSFQAHCTTSFP